MVAFGGAARPFSADATSDNDALDDLASTTKRAKTGGSEFNYEEENAALRAALHAARDSDSSDFYKRHPNGRQSYAHLPPMSDEEKAELDAEARRIFGHRPWSPVRTGNKVLRKKLVGPLFESFYSKPFEDVLRSKFPEYLTEKEERRKQKLAYMRRRGKGPPKKGQGKRAGKKK